MRLRLLVPILATTGMPLLAQLAADLPVRANLRPSIFAPRRPMEVSGASESLPGAAPPAQIRPRAITPAMAAKLSDVLRRVAPPPEAPRSTETVPGPTKEDSRNVIPLEPYFVEEERLPRFKERELLTRNGKIALARRRYPAADAASALLLLAADFEKERRQEMTDLRELLEIGDTPLSPQLRRTLDQTATRSGGMPGRSYRLPR